MGLAFVWQVKGDIFLWGLGGWDFVILMRAQQNFMRVFNNEKKMHSSSLISKIDNQAVNFKTLVSQLRMAKRTSAGDIPFNMQSQLEISGIEPCSENYEKNSFDLQLPTDFTAKKSGITMAPLKDREIRDIGDRGLKYKPRSSVNGRDDIHLRNLNEAHKKIVDSLDKQRRHQSEDKRSGKDKDLEDFDSNIERLLNPQIAKTKRQTRSRVLYTPDNRHRKQSPSSHQKKDSYHTQQPTKRLELQQKMSNDQKFLQIDAKQLLDYMMKLSNSAYPAANCPPNQIYGFFMNICQSFGVQEYFHQPLIKRYRNCVYFGQKMERNGNQTYMGFVWYYRKALYYGEFIGGKKHGYGVEVDVEERGCETIWRGNFYQGKKTGYFQMISPVMEYNGTMVSSYFDGEGELKVKGKSIYKGAFQAGMKQGYGVQTFFNNKSLTYKGEYMNSKFEGKGVLEGPNYHYKGEFRSNKPHGTGFERTDQFEYVGQFKNGKREGQGLLKMRDGQVYEGLFRQGRIVNESPKKSSQYIKNIPIQSFSRNHETSQMEPSHQLPQSVALKLQLSSISSPHKSSISPRPIENRRHLSKYLSKDLMALDEQNEQGTIQNPNQRFHPNKHNSRGRLAAANRVDPARRWDTRGEEDDEQQPLETKILPFNY